MPENNYSQYKAMLAITKASLIAQFKSPSAVIFGFLFPMFFILIFGSGGGGMPSVAVAIKRGSDSANMASAIVKVNPILRIREYEPGEAGDFKMKDDLLKGRITAILEIKKSSDTNSAYIIEAVSSKASQERMQILNAVINGIISGIDKEKNKNKVQQPTYAAYSTPEPIGDRVYKRIDFILPGQLGFSLLSAGLFGISFLFFSLRETLVLKRFNATPLSRPFIIIGEAIARVIFQFVILSVIILMGKYLFGFTLVHGFTTFAEMMFICFIGLFVFMGFGFVISGISKNINVVPAITNAIGFPQFMLSGTFFPYEGLPKFLHPISKALPLTHLNDALRKISFEGLHLDSCWKQLGILGIWAVVIYAIAIKVFKWE
jgi:ABC-2 type transport system permease protein